MVFNDQKETGSQILSYSAEGATKLGDELISCNIPDKENDKTHDDKAQKYGYKTLRQIVTEVQIQHCTKSCKKYNGSCRYGFSRLQSKETILVEPLPPIKQG